MHGQLYLNDSVAASSLALARTHTARTPHAHRTCAHARTLACTNTETNRHWLVTSLQTVLIEYLLNN